MFRYDLHTHTSEVSRCGNIPAKEVVRLYREGGYQGVLMTDHYYADYFNAMGSLPWEEKAARYLEGYRIAKREGDACGFDVLLGIELRFEGTQDDYLIIGLDEEFLIAHPFLYALGRDGFRRLARENGLLIYQAHPFRPGMQPDPAFLDGVEGYNGNKRHNSHDDKAKAFAAEHGLPLSSGSDFHELEDLCRGGVILPRRVKTAKELAAVLREGPVELIETL